MTNAHKHFLIMCFTILKEPKSKCLKKCSLAPENTGFWGITLSPPKRENTIELSCPRTTSNRNVYTIFEENRSNNAKSRVRQIYLFYSSINIYTVLKHHLTGDLGTRIGGSFHRQGDHTMIVINGHLFLYVTFLPI